MKPSHVAWRRRAGRSAPAGAGALSGVCLLHEHAQPRAMRSYDGSILLGQPHRGGKDRNGTLYLDGRP